jgi:hypothetical protein
MQELTSFPIQDKIWHERNFTRDAHISTPHLEFAVLSNRTQVCGDQTSLVNVPSLESYQSVVVDVAHMFLGITAHHSFQSPPERLVTKNTRRTTLS